MKPQPHVASGAEFGEALEDRADRAAYCLVRIKPDFAFTVSPNKADRDAVRRARPCANTAIQTGTKDVQLCFAHRTPEAEQQTIVLNKRDDRRRHYCRSKYR
jgi:hypothetical protein